MARFSGTKRNCYTSEKVRQMRSERKTKKAKVDGVKDKHYQMSLGDLIGAGHLKLNGFRGVDTDIEYSSTSKDCLIKKTIRIENWKLPNRDERPHVEGYLASGHPKDPVFRIKGWFNEDGVLRIELVTNHTMIP